MFYQRRIAALKYLIDKNQTIQPIGKRVLWFLLDQSRGLTREVCVTLKEGEEFSAEEIKKATSVAVINSSSSTTPFDAVMIAAGTKFLFTLHYGYFEGNQLIKTGQFFGDPTPLSYTFWLAKKYYSRTAKRLTVSRAELEAIDLRKSGLYPYLENQPNS